MLPKHNQTSGAFGCPCEAKAEAPQAQLLQMLRGCEFELLVKILAVVQVSSKLSKLMKKAEPERAPPIYICFVFAKAL
jgi:hypothetical protein